MSQLDMTAMRTNTSGSYNTATGYRALYSNTTGANNIPQLGSGALIFQHHRVVAIPHLGIILYVLTPKGITILHLGIILYTLIPQGIEIPHLGTVLYLLTQQGISIPHLGLIL